MGKDEELEDYEIIVSNSLDMIALLDNTYTYISLNKVYSDAFGLKKRDIIGKTVSEVFGKEFFETVIKPRAEKCMKERKKVNYSEWFDFPATGKKYMNITYSPYLSDKNEIRGFVVIARDETDKKRLEEENIDKIGELEKFNKMVVGRETKMADLKNRITELEEKSKNK